MAEAGADGLRECPTQASDRPGIGVRAATGQSATLINCSADERIFATRKPANDHFAHPIAEKARCIAMRTIIPSISRIGFAITVGRARR